MCGWSHVIDDEMTKSKNENADISMSIIERLRKEEEKIRLGHDFSHTISELPTA